MNTKVYLLAAVAALILAVAAVEGVMILHGPAVHQVAGQPASGSDLAAVAVSPSPLGEGGPSGPGEGLRPTTTNTNGATAEAKPLTPETTAPTLTPAPAAEPTAAPASSAAPAALPDATPASAAPAELTPAEKAARKDAEYRHALGVLADQQIEQFSKMLDLTADQRQAAAPTFAKLKSIGVNIQVTADQLQHVQAQAADQPSVLVATPAAKQTMQNLMNQMGAQLNDFVNAFGELKPILTDPQSSKLDALTEQFKLAQKQVQDAQAVMNNADNKAASPPAPQN